MTHNSKTTSDFKTQTLQSVRKYLTRKEVTVQTLNFVKIIQENKTKHDIKECNKAEFSITKR